MLGSAFAKDPAFRWALPDDQLLKEGLERSSRPVWLETTNPRNVAFYERHGFVVQGRRSVPNDVTLVGLLREP